MLIVRDLGFLGCLTTMSPRSVSNSWHFLTGLAAREGERERRYWDRDCDSSAGYGGLAVGA